MTGDGRWDLTPLVIRMQAGDTAAYEQIFLHRKARMLRRVRGFGVSEADAFDVTQTGWMHCWKKRGTIRNPEHFDAWLRKLMDRCAQTWIRRHRQELSRRDPAVEVDSLLDSPVAVDRVKLDELLLGVPADERRALVLKYREGKTVREIAAMTGWSQERVEYLLERGRSLLRKKFEAPPDTGGDGGVTE